MMYFVLHDLCLTISHDDSHSIIIKLFMSCLISFAYGLTSRGFCSCVRHWSCVEHRSTATPPSPRGSFQSKCWQTRCACWAAGGDGTSRGDGTGHGPARVWPRTSRADTSYYCAIDRILPPCWGPEPVGRGAKSRSQCPAAFAESSMGHCSS
jgi:hypothetical protein